MGPTWDPHGSHLFPTWVPHGSQCDTAAISHMGSTWFPHGSHKDPQGSHMRPTWFPHASHVDPMWAFSVGNNLILSITYDFKYDFIKLQFRPILTQFLYSGYIFNYNRLYKLYKRLVDHSEQQRKYYNNIMIIIYRHVSRLRLYIFMYNTYRSRQSW